MKELSIEEKAKAYDKAKSIVEKYLKSGSAGVIAENTIKKAFPELSEPEDEKIRKELIHLVKKSYEYGGYALHKYEADRMLVWLEKQYEQKSAWSEDDIEMLNSAILFVEHSAFTTIGKGKNNVISWLKSLKDRVQPRQEWKQENINDLTDFENAMMHIGGSFFGENAGLDPNDTNAIKEQANLLLEFVPKQEWSDEDEKFFKTALWHISYSISNGESTDIHCDTTNWLKSLKQRIGG